MTDANPEDWRLPPEATTHLMIAEPHWRSCFISEPGKPAPKERADNPKVYYAFGHHEGRRLSWNIDAAENAKLPALRHLQP